MKKFLVAAFILIVNINYTSAQNADNHRLLIILDASEDMHRSWNDKKTYYKAASDLINYLADSIYVTNPDVTISMRVYGQGSPAAMNNCKDSRNEIIFGRNNRTQIELRLLDIKPKGKAALGFAIEQASKYDLLPTAEPIHCNSVLFVTASENTCDGDLCSLSRSLLDKKITGKQFVVSLKDNIQMRSAYECLGSYVTMTNGKDMHEVVATIAAFYETDEVEDEETIQRPIAEVENDPVINSFKTFREKEVIDTSKETFVLFTSDLNATDIVLQIQDGRSFKAYASDAFVLPMKDKRAVKSARYRISYNIDTNGVKETRIKEFYARMNKDNIVVLD